MRFIAWLKRWNYVMMAYVHRIQFALFSLVLIGVADYFFLYEIFVALAPLELAAAPILLSILAFLLIRGTIRHVKRKAKEKMHFIFI